MHEGSAALGDARPHPARVYDCLLEGKDNYLADQEVAEELAARWPEIQQGVRENRRWMHRAVRYLAREAGIRQFLDIGTGIPTRPNLHEVAQEVEPTARVAYVDNDPLVLNHAEALLTPLTEQGRTIYLQADLRQPGRILASERLNALLDLREPVGLTLVAILHFLEESERPEAILEELVAALPSGSYVALSHACGDAAPASAKDAAAFYREREVSAPVVPRSEARINGFFAGLELLEPGVVPVSQWHPDGPDLPEAVWFYGGVARKP
ncbi:SAM-dependent methyltransferase [Streptomyces oceani]|uniref:Methyltransferase n=1 Tax=Streptomyces oceani TaxID=1075402 RepID=A0A1E7KP93_9ACTN|nr:SAM-dependent methyltransferase [Streptomyces oceani]OEV05641.1 methyltransferase [Streptomyces oceani]